jgi:hypothetical protein
LGGSRRPLRVPPVYKRLMTINLSLITVTIVLLTTAGFAGPPRPRGAEPLPREAQPDIKDLIRSGVDKMFTRHPHAVAVAPPRRISAHQVSACVKALVPGLIDGRMRPTTLVVTIIRGKIADRRRASLEDHCESETYENVIGQLTE